MSNKTWKEITITSHLLNRLLNRNKLIPKNVKGVNCHRCKKTFPIGTKIIRHRQARVLTRYYCKPCYEGLWI